MPKTTNAPAILAELKTESLLTLWEDTEYLHGPEAATLRGWLMYELENRNRRGFSAWLDQDAPEDRDLRRYITVNPICLNCARWRGDYAGTENQVWTGCVKRR